MSVARDCARPRPRAYSPNGRRSPAALLPATAILLFAFVVPALGLRCIRCGEYTDGVGSITPCLNFTESQHLKDCTPEAHFCVKYVTEASIVRECLKECEEKEAWGTKMYCCNEDGCNGAVLTRGHASLFLCSLLLVLRRILW